VNNNTVHIQQITVSNRQQVTWFGDVATVMPVNPLLLIMWCILMYQTYTYTLYMMHPTLSQ